MEWISIEDLLAEEGAQTDDLAIDFVEPAEELLSDTAVTKAPIFDDTSETAGPINSVDLERLARIICDRISPLLEIEQERNGFPKSTSLLWRAASPGQSGQLQLDALTRLTQAMTHRLYRRLEIEQERQGFTQGCLPW
ncbi:MAG: hypothetical protein ACFCU8_12645 [Thermosynechococcaceae cyanobacterium]